MPVLRSVRSAIAKAVRRAIGYVTDTIYGAGGFEPSLTADFTEEFYRGPGVSNFTDLITHARAGNATMTDGYGTELLINGDFATGDTTGWDTDGNPTVSRGVVTIPIDSGTSEYIEQTVSTESGKTYIVTYDYVDADLDSRISRLSVNDGNNGGFTGSQLAEGVSLNNSNGKVEGVFTAASSNSTVRIINSTSTNGSFTSIDNVSVREMPVIKFAPHNYQKYSDDVSQGSGSTGVTRTATTLTETTSTGEHRIQCGIAPPVVGEKYTMAVEAKSGTGSRLIGFRGYGEGGAEKYPVFDIVNGTVRQAGTAFTDVSITDVGDGYYLCKASVVPSSSFRWAVHMADETATPANNAVHNYTGDGSSSVLLRKIRQYRSDLGGMVDNPDNSGNDADFIATSGSAAYLPRIGHHVYNGSAWVNEGVLAESEARTNLVTYSTPDSNWSNSDSTDTANQAVAPDGTDTATLLVDTTVNANHYITSPDATIVSGALTGSMYVKKESISFARLRLDGTSGNRRAWFNLDDGTVGSVDANAIATIQDVGNGWFRLSLTEPDNTNSGTAKLQLFLNTADSETSYVGDGSGAYLWGAQLEQAYTPSSLIPTSGSSVSRAAETFTIPSANLPWPTPQYIGSELVDNGDFATTSDWSLQSGVSIGGGVLSTDGTSTGELARQSDIGITSGNLYAISLDVISLTAGKFGVKLGGTTPVYFDTTGSNEAYIIATATDNVQIMGLSGTIGSVDNVSVREINPLSVCIGMEGRVTYADTGSTSEVTFVGWPATGNQPHIRNVMRTNGSYKGALLFKQYDGSTSDSAFEPTPGSYLPDILVPYNIASRHGSTFINGATDGVALTANTTPTALPDLSSTDLSLAYDYMGTISEFRVWDKDITDAGLVEATEPSLEPSLSLTFEGVGTNSFTVSDWSE